MVHRIVYPVSLFDVATNQDAYTLVSWLRVDQRTNCAYISHVAQVSDTAQVTRQVSFLSFNYVRTRQEISKHISITYILCLLDYAHIRSCSKILYNSLHQDTTIT